MGCGDVGYGMDFSFRGLVFCACVVEDSMLRGEMRARIRSSCKGRGMLQYSIGSQGERRFVN